MGACTRWKPEDGRASLLASKNVADVGRFFSFCLSKRKKNDIKSSPSSLARSLSGLSCSQLRLRLARDSSSDVLLCFYAKSATIRACLEDAPRRPPFFCCCCFDLIQRRARQGRYPPSSPRSVSVFSLTFLFSSLFLLSNLLSPCATGHAASLVLLAARIEWPAAELLPLPRSGRRWPAPPPRPSRSRQPRSCLARSLRFRSLRPLLR